MSLFSFITVIPTTLLKTSRNAFFISNNSKTSKTTFNTDQPLGKTGQGKTIGKKLVLELVLELVLKLVLKLILMTLRLKLVWVVWMVRVVWGTNVLLTPRTTLIQH